MHSINVHINETLDTPKIDALRQQLLADPFVSHVEMRTEMPHDILVEFEEHHDVPLHVLQLLKQDGFHADIVGC